MVHKHHHDLALEIEPIAGEPEGVSVEFWAATIVMTAMPGTGSLFTIAAGLARGTRAGLVAAAGCTLGIVPHLTLAPSRRRSRHGRSIIIRPG